MEEVWYLLLCISIVNAKQYVYMCCTFMSSRLPRAMGGSPPVGLNPILMGMGMR